MSAVDDVLRAARHPLVKDSIARIQKYKGMLESAPTDPNDVKRHEKLEFRARRCLSNKYSLRSPVLTQLERIAIDLEQMALVSGLDDARWPTVKETAAMLEISSGQVSRLHGDGTLKTNGRSGKSLRIDPLSIIEHVRNTRLANENK